MAVALQAAFTKSPPRPSEVAEAQRRPAVRMLDRSDRLLHQAHLDHSALRARWWNLKGNALWDRSDARDERAAAFKNALALFAATAPQDTDYPTALTLIARSKQPPR